MSGRAWEKQYKRKKGHVSWLYVMKNEFMYPDLLKDILTEAMRDIRSAAPQFNAVTPASVAK